MVLVRSDPRDVPRIVQLSRASYRKMVQNLWWASGYNDVPVDVPVNELRDGKAVPRKAEAISADLTKRSVYGLLDQKAVTTWLDLRNKAAHGRYTDYNQEQVRGMVTAVREFI